MIGRLWARWLAFLARTEEGTSLGLVRIFVGACVAGSLLSVWSSGVLEMLWFPAKYGGIRQMSEGSFLIEALGGPKPDVVMAVFYTTLITSLALMVGVGGPIGGRILAFLTLQGFMGLTDLNSHAGGSYDELMNNSLWLLVLGDGTASFSLTTWLREGTWRGSRRVGTWARSLFAWQLVLMYWTTGLQKVSAYWTPGGDFSALYYILQQPTWHRHDMEWVARWGLFPATQFATAVTWFWEVTAIVIMGAWIATLHPRPTGRVWVWMARLRLREVYAAVGAFFHMVIFSTMNVGPFSWASLALYPALVHPWEWPWARSAELEDPALPLDVREDAGDGLG